MSTDYARLISAAQALLDNEAALQEALESLDQLYATAQDIAEAEDEAGRLEGERLGCAEQLRDALQAAFPHLVPLTPAEQAEADRARRALMALDRRHAAQEGPA